MSYGNKKTIISITANKSIPAGLYWTSASDDGCEGKFGWCTVKKLVWKGVFAAGQPDNAGGNENCLGINLDTNKSELQDEVCATELFYICEVLRVCFFK
jgi:hypothetical protein